MTISQFLQTNENEDKDMLPQLGSFAFAASGAASSGSSSGKRCILCLTKPADATFVHGGTGHMVCCMGC